MTTPEHPGTPLIVFHDGTEWYAAESIDDLCGLWGHTGGVEYFEPGTWEVVPPDKSLTVWCEGDGVPTEPDSDGSYRVTKTAAEWAAQLGRGMLFSTEY